MGVLTNTEGKMRRLVLVSCDTITLMTTNFINAVKAATNGGEPAMHSVTIGMDLSDKNNAICILNNSGKIVDQATVANTSQKRLGLIDDLKEG